MHKRRSRSKPTV